MARVGVWRCLGAAVLFGVSAPAASVLASDMPAPQGTVAGSVNVALGLTLASGTAKSLTAGSMTGRRLGAALLVGAAGYGLSIVWWVKGARDLGAARAQVILATAPFIGALGAWLVLSVHTASGHGPHRMISGVVAAGPENEPEQKGGEDDCKQGSAHMRAPFDRIG